MAIKPMQNSKQNLFEKALAQNGAIVLDGGLATELEAQGCDIGNELWSAGMLRSNPSAIVDAHLAFLEAGANIIISASYQASRTGFMPLGLSEQQADDLIVSSVDLAHAARQKFLDAHSDASFMPMVAASIGPYGATGHDGSEYTGDYIRPVLLADTDNGKKNGADEVPETKVFVTEHQAKFIRNSH